MFRHALGLCLLLPFIGRSSASDPVQVISGVFMVNNISVDYYSAKVACASYYSRLASLEQITNAFNHGYEFCKWGWVEEHKIAMLRLTPFLACSGYNLGILIRDCPNIRSVFCVNETGLDAVTVSTIAGTPSYENASNTCTQKGLNIATSQQIQNQITTNTITNQGIAWFNYGVGQINNKNFVLNTCYDTASKATAFCYNPSLADVLINNDTETVKKITIGSLIALIFVILITAAIFMRGNKFICCMGSRRTPHTEVAPQSPQPTWNTTSIYRRISQVNRDLAYDNRVSIKKPSPAIRPEMRNYRTHYNNMAFEEDKE